MSWVALAPLQRGADEPPLRKHQLYESQQPIPHSGIFRKELPKELVVLLDFIVGVRISSRTLTQRDTSTSQSSRQSTPESTHSFDQNSGPVLSA